MVGIYFVIKDNLVGPLESKVNRGSTSDPKWQALVDVDADVSRAARTIRESYGPRYESILAQKYLALGDRQYLENIVQNVIEKAKTDALRPRDGKIGKVGFTRNVDGDYVTISGPAIGKIFEDFEQLENFVKTIR